MGIFSKVRKLLRGGKPLPFEHGPASLKRDENGKWIHESIPKPKSEVVINVIPATTSGKADCVCGSGQCKCEDNRKRHAESKKVPPVIEGINKKAAAAKKPVAKTTAKKDAIKKDIADTPVAKKPAPKKTSTAPATKKPTPKKK